MIQWHKKEDLPDVGKWVLVELDSKFKQKFKVFNYSKENCLTTGNYPECNFSFQNYDVTPIIRWAYIDDITKTNSL